MYCRGCSSPSFSCIKAAPFATPEQSATTKYGLAKSGNANTGAAASAAFKATKLRCCRGPHSGVISIIFDWQALSIFRSGMARCAKSLQNRL